MGDRDDLLDRAARLLERCRDVFGNTGRLSAEISAVLTDYKAHEPAAETTEREREREDVR